VPVLYAFYHTLDVQHDLQGLPTRDRRGGKRFDGQLWVSFSEPSSVSTRSFHAHSMIG
jgi:hypothetical protein